jgi:hypothetical protein
MGHVQATVRDCSRAQLLDMPGEIHTLDHLARTGHQHVLHRVPKGATYEEILEALEDRFGDQHMATAYHIQLKSGTQGVRESLQEFITAVKKLAHCTNPHYSRAT